MTQTKICSKCGLPKPLEEFYSNKRTKDGRRYDCKACNKEYIKHWQKENSDKVKEYQAKKYKQNSEKINERTRIQYKNNPEKVKGRVSRWQKENPEKEKAKTSRHRARKRSLPAHYTAQHWQAALQYFNHCCAVCGRQFNNLLGDFTAAMDHWIPLSAKDCPGTTPDNIIPLCHGVGGCNNSKGSKDAKQWLVETYGKKKAKEILMRIEEYFNHVKGIQK